MSDKIGWQLIPGKVWNVPITAVLQGWLVRSLFAAVPQKGVNNQMEVNYRPIQSGGDDENTTKAFKGWSTTFTMVIYREIVHFLTSLNAGRNICSWLMFIFSELELCAKTARLIQSYNKNVSFNTAIFRVLPHILSLCKLGNGQSYEFKGLEDLQI